MDWWVNQWWCLVNLFLLLLASTSPSSISTCLRTLLPECKGCYKQLGIHLRPSNLCTTTSNWSPPRSFIMFIYISFPINSLHFFPSGVLAIVYTHLHMSKFSVCFASKRSRKQLPSQILVLSSFFSIEAPLGLPSFSLYFSLLPLCFLWRWLIYLLKQQLNDMIINKLNIIVFIFNML